MQTIAVQYAEAHDETRRDALAEEALNVLRHQLPAGYAALQQEYREEMRAIRALALLSHLLYFPLSWLFFGLLGSFVALAVLGPLSIRSLLLCSILVAMLPLLALYRRFLRRRGMLKSSQNPDPEAHFLRRKVRESLKGDRRGQALLPDPPSLPAIEGQPWRGLQPSGPRVLHMTGLDLHIEGMSARSLVPSPPTESDPMA